MRIMLLTILLLAANFASGQSGLTIGLSYGAHCNSESVKPYRLSPAGAWEVTCGYQAIRKERFSILGNIGVGVQQLSYRINEAMRYNNQNTFASAAFSASLFNVREAYLFGGIGADVLLAHVEEVRTDYTAQNTVSVGFDEVRLDPTEVNASVMLIFLQPVRIQKNNRLSLALRLKQNLLRSYNSPVQLHKILHGAAVPVNPRLTTFSVGLSYKFGKHGQRSEG